LGRNTIGAAVAAPLRQGRARTVVAALAAAVAALALSATPAGATTGHTAAAPFGIPGSGDPGGFAYGGPTGIAVRQSTGDVFVTDTAHTDADGAPAPRVERFDASGAFEDEFPLDPALYISAQAIAIDPNGSGALYVGATDQSYQGAVLKYALDGDFQHALVPDADTTLNPSAVAVDPATGDVYVGATDTSDPDANVPIVEVFDAAGVFQTRFDGGDGNDAPLGGIAGLAADGSGHVYVTDPTKNRVDRFSDGGTFQATVVDGNDRGVSLGALATDPTNGELYVVENGGQVEYFSAGGAAHLDVFDSSGAAVTGLAVDAAGGTVYLADQGQAMGLTATAFAGPTVVTTGASSVDATSATLEGTVDPEGDDADFSFEYGTDGSYGSRTPSLPVGDGTSAVPVSAPVADLLPNTRYHFRVVGSRGDDAISGADATFTTDPAPPVLDGTPSGVSPPFASDIGPDGATINGTIDPRGSSTTYSVEYGTTTAYGSSEPAASPLEGQGDQPAVVPIAGLAPGTTYHFRLVADNGTGGAQPGQDATFRTAPAAPAGASSVTAVSAELTGVVDLHGGPAKYRFQYGESTSYDNATPLRDVGPGSGNTTVTASIDGLKPGTTYHVRAVEIDTATGITTSGVDGTFTTDPAARVSTGTVTDVTPSHATFHGDADTHGLGGAYWFFVQASSSAYIAATPEARIPAGAGSGPVSGTLSDLLPGQTYTVRLAVRSSGYTAVGDAVTFSTPPAPPVQPPAPPPAQVADPYGCVAPVLSAYDAHPRPGDTITVAGRDLGVGGTIALGDRTLTPTSWTATALTFTLPADAKGSLPLTVNCGKVSNTIAVQMFQAPSNAFTTKSKVSGTTATLTLKVPGPGDIAIRGAGVKAVKRHVGQAGTYVVKATLSASGKRSLRRHKRLSSTLTVSFTPNGGTTAKKTTKVTFQRR